MRTRVLATRKTKTHLGGYTMASINNNPGMCASLYESSRTNLSKFSELTKTYSASAGNILSRISGAVSGFFSSFIQTLGSWIGVAKDSFVAAKGHFGAAPRSVQIITTLSIAGVAALGVFLGSRCGNTPVAAAANAATQGQTSSAEFQES